MSEGPALSLMLCCQCLEIYMRFEQEALGGRANCVPVLLAGYQPQVLSGKELAGCSHCRGSRGGLHCYGVAQRPPAEVGVGSRPPGMSPQAPESLPNPCGHAYQKHHASFASPTEPQNGQFRDTKFRGSPNPECCLPNW